MLHNNYYRISGYSLTLRDHDEFYPGTTFQNIMDIYHFDRELRMILLCAIDKIETTFKSIYAYEFAKKYGALGYRTSSNFNDPQQCLSLVQSFDEKKEERLQHEAFLKHFAELEQDVPIWALTEVITLADISKLYRISKSDLQQAVAAQFKLNFKGAEKTLANYMHGMTIVRNLCAHSGRLYNRLFVTKPNLNSKEKKLLYRKDDGSLVNAKLAGYILNMKRLLSQADFSLLKEDILALCERYPFVEMKHYGFGADWQALL